MNAQQLELTRLIGKKELTFGCEFECIDRENSFYIASEHGIFNDNKIAVINKRFVSTMSVWLDILDLENIVDTDGNCFRIIGHPATLSDLHRWMNNNLQWWRQSTEGILFAQRGEKFRPLEEEFIPISSNRELIDQSEKTLKQLIELITSYQ